MSHELRTPLNGIIGFSELMIDGKAGKLAEKQEEYLTDIHNSGKHLLQLINDVLDLAKVESGKMEIYPERFSVKKSIEEVTNVVSPLAKNKNISINIDVIKDLKDVKIDKQKFKQILYNLMSNSVKFTDDGGHINISGSLYDDNQFCIKVTDTGIGIKKEDFAKLFYEFQQIDSGMARKYQGTGLGLALTKKIIEFQRGKVEVESEYGKGSTFTVILPTEIDGGGAVA
jgi:signal transduction histidine kinase